MILHHVAFGFTHHTVCVLDQDMEDQYEDSLEVNTVIVKRGVAPNDLSSSLVEEGLQGCSKTSGWFGFHKRFY